MKVLCLGAGGPAGVNFCRAARAAGHYVIGIDENRLHLPWLAEICDETHVCDHYGIAIEQCADADTFVHAQPESGVQWLADNDFWPARKFVPSRQIVSLCQDKFETGLVWRRLGLRFDRIELLELIEQAADVTYPAWIRARRGAGARGAFLADNRQEAELWLELWAHKEPAADFVAEDHLPGRDFCWTSLWHNGELLAAFTRERLEWIYPHLSPFGRTGTPTVARIVHDADVNEMAEAAVRAVSYATDTPAHGVFCVDLVEDWEGIPRPTEINAGRWATTSPIWAPELVADQIALGFGEPVDRSNFARGLDFLPAGRTLYRHIDCPTLLVEEPCLVS